MKKFFVGIDVSKSFIDVSYHNGNYAIYLDNFANTDAGFREMINALKQHTKQAFKYWFICFENTGVYSKLLLEFLFSKKIDCREESGLQINYSLGIKRGKNDKADSKDICQYCFEKRDHIKASEPLPKTITKLRKLVNRRELLVRHKRALYCSLKDQKAVLEEQFYENLKVQNQEIIDLYNIQIGELEKQIKQVIESDEVMKNNDELAQSVISIGLVTSAHMLAYTLNYTCFTDPRKFSSYCGVAPFSFQSGSSVKRANKVSHLANKRIKALLSNCVANAIRYDKELKMYYHKKLSEGKEKGVVLNAIKSKLIHRVFAVIKRQTPFVPMKTYV